MVGRLIDTELKIMRMEAVFDLKHYPEIAWRN
jgi:hypothetical protein